MARTGRPMLFKTPDELQSKIDDYFADTEFFEYTVTGLALYLGTTRETLDDYQARDDYRDIVKMAKLKVENSYELSLRKSGRTGDIFALKNFGWKDKVEHDLNNPDGHLNAFGGLTIEELRKLAGS